MDSEYIKSAVNKIKYLKEKGDLEFKLLESKKLGINLLIVLVEHFEKAPVFVTAMYVHMTDTGINISCLKGEALTKFTRVYGNKIDRLNEVQSKSLRKIAETLFKNI